jgi:acyl-CoA thioester hydrolase
MEIDPRLFLHRAVVKPEWIDEYGHLNMAYYVLVCDSATFRFWAAMNGGREVEARDGNEYAVVETHVNYLDEVREGDPLLVTTQLIAADAKRFRIFHTMHHERKGYLAATNEVMALGFNLQTRRLMEFLPEVQAKLRETLADHAALPMPENAGRAIGQPRKRATA